MNTWRRGQGVTYRIPAKACAPHLNTFLSPVTKRSIHLSVAQQCGRSAGVHGLRGEEGGEEGEQQPAIGPVRRRVHQQPATAGRVERGE